MPTEAQLRHALPLLQASLERSNPSGNTLEGVLQTIAAGNATLWTGPRSAIVTQPVFAQRIWHAGGEFADMVQVMTRAWELMKANGFDELRIENTRKGWLKQLRPHGFEQVMALVKED